MASRLPPPRITNHTSPHPSTVILGIIFVPVVLFVQSVIQGFVLSVLWRWFISSQFGVKAISVPVAVGLSVLIGLLTNETDVDPVNTSFSYAVLNGFIQSMVLSSLALIIGWVALQFVH